MSNSNIKKAFVELVQLLESNKEVKVSDILPKVLVLATSKKKDEVVKKDANGKITHIFCWYHKEWEDVNTHVYGKKASSSTGLNTMCKIGVNQWTKQQAEASKEKFQVLDDVEEGKIKPQNIRKELEKVELRRMRIIPLKK